MESDTLIFFESPDFPRHMTDNEKSQCTINFTKRISLQEQAKRFVIVTSNILCDDDVYDGCNRIYSSYFNFTSYALNLTDNPKILNYRAFQGFAYFDDWGDDCPLESVSRINPFQFTDSNEVIVFRSTYDPSESRYQSCLWQFKAPKNYGFKIVFTDFNILNSTILKVQNTRDTFITPENVRVSQPHYSIDNYLKVYLSINKNPYFPPFQHGEPTYELTAYVTIIQNFFNNVAISCNSTIPLNPNSTTFWSYWNDNGYLSNGRCTHMIKIKPKMEVIATLQNSELEDNVDMINFYEVNNSIPSGQLKKGCVAAVFPTEDEKEEREILWEFISDGSVQLRGFNVSFNSTYCNCANPSIIVPCTGKIDAYIMDGAGDFYCGNLNCNFTVIQTQ
uniref:CUB domain-containing protein n=1 Tax=Panagrolaimus superbus TaxID=310955 RepID=A0A914Y1H7_9BILA